MRLNFRLEGYVSPQYPWIVRYGNGHTTTLPMEVFTQRNFIADYSIEVNVYFQKTKKSLFQSPFGGLRGNVRGRLPIPHN